MLVKGNSKLGKKIWHFSIPAFYSCPGASDLCADRCYARKGFFRLPEAQNKHYTNWDLSKKETFVIDMTNELLKKKVTICRIHVAGDFYDAAYVRKWLEIVKLNPTVRFYAYTRSWRVKDMEKPLAKLSTLANMRMWYSADQDTGLPEDVPEKVRIAYLTVDEEDLPQGKVQLIFRDHGIRPTVRKKIGGIFVCPPENGIKTKINCSTCGVCWTDKGPESVIKTIKSKRIPLQTVTL